MASMQLVVRGLFHCSHHKQWKTRTISVGTGSIWPRRQIDVYHFLQSWTVPLHGKLSAGSRTVLCDLHWFTLTLGCINLPLAINCQLQSKIHLCIIALDVLMDQCDLDTFLLAVLDQELKLPSNDIRSNKFFHGQINRQTTEELLTQNGTFLVRESCSQSGQYVLSCLHNETHLHFLIHEHRIESTDKKTQFSFEGQLFNSVRELVDFHVTKQEPITMVSGAVINEPVYRNLPIEVCKLAQYYQSRSNVSLTALLKDIQITEPIHSYIKSETDNVSLMDDVCFSTDYLIHLKSGVSAINLERLANLQWTNDDLCESVCKTIAQTGPRILASHLFKRNLAFIGLDFDQNSLEHTNNLFLLRSGIELMCLPEGKQIRRDIIIRHECLKYFVVMTIVKAEDFITRCNSLKKWIQIANLMISSLGDYFGFGAIMAGLCHAKIKALKTLWQHLRISQPKESFIYETLLQQFMNLLKAEGELAPNTTFPFVIQLCHLIECNYIVNSKLLPLFQNIQLPDIIQTEAENHDKIGLGDFSLDNILKHINLSTNILDKLSLFENNAKLISEGLFFREYSLEEIFKTAFHMRFLFNQEMDIIQLNHEIFRNLENRLTIDEQG